MERYSKMYAFLRPYFRFYHNRFWYKTVRVRGYENWPDNTPVIVAPNHQNALMDALAFVLTLKRQIVFLARADIFANPKIAAILTFMRILPIYRIRDGAQSLGKNEEIFNKAGKILEVKHEIGIFPEAQHWGFRKLRAIKKGVPRIAFQIESENDFKLGSVVLPVGLYYDEYQPFRKKLLVNYGKPIPVADFKDIYLENENKGFMALRKAMTEGMKKVMMHIETDEYYDDVENIRQIVSYAACTKSGRNPNKIADEFDADCETVKQLDEMIVSNEDHFKTLKGKADILLSLLERLHVSKRILASGGLSNLRILSDFIIGAVLFPLFLIGFVFNIIPKTILDRFVNAKIKDPQFVRSFKFALGFFLLPICYGISLGVIAWFIDLHWYCWFGALLSLPLFAVIAHEYSVGASYWWQSVRFRFGLINKQRKIQALKIYNEIVDAVL